MTFFPPTCSEHVHLPTGTQVLGLQGNVQVGFMQQPDLVNTTNPLISTQLAKTDG